MDRVLTGTDAVDQALHEAYDPLILDVMMPGLDGWEVIRRLRAAGQAVPALFLTARDGLDDWFKGLECWNCSCGGTERRCPNPCVFPGLGHDLALNFTALIHSYPVYGSV